MPFGVHSWEGVFAAANERCERVLTPAAWAADWRDAHDRLDDLRQRLGDGLWAQGLSVSDSLCAGTFACPVPDVYPVSFLRAI